MFAMGRGRCRSQDISWNILMQAWAAISPVPSRAEKHEAFTDGMASKGSHLHNEDPLVRLS